MKSLQEEEESKLDAQLTELEESMETPSFSRRASIPAGNVGNRNASETATSSSNHDTSTSNNNNNNNSSSSHTTGRAMLDSIATHLRSLRRRMEAAASSLTSSANQRLQERLEVAELAHSARAPLDVVRERRQAAASSSAAVLSPQTLPQQQQRLTQSMPLSRASSESSSRDSSFASANNAANSVVRASRRLEYDNQDDLFSPEEHQAAAQLLPRINETTCTADNATTDTSCTDDNMLEDELQQPKDSKRTKLSDKEDNNMDSNREMPLDTNTKNETNTDSSTQNEPMEIETILQEEEEDEEADNAPNTMVIAKSTSQDLDIMMEDASEEVAAQSQHADNALYSWGLTGTLLLHDDEASRTPENAKVEAASRLGKPGASPLISIATSVTHTACATLRQGTVLTCGYNECGSVDPMISMMTISSSEGDHDSYNNQNTSNNKKIIRPQLLECLSMMNVRIHQVSCGYDHTAALSDQGIVLTWGSNQYGQLGHRQQSLTTPSNKTVATPQGLVLPGGCRAASVACGHYFTLVLTTRMCVFGCGIDTITGSSAANAGSITANSNKQPTTIPALQGLPLVAIAAGHSHAVVVSSNGTAYAWGDNKYGECGRTFPQHLSIPMEMITPPTQQSKHQITSYSSTTGTHSQLVVPTPPTTKPNHLFRQKKKHHKLVDNPFPNWASWEEKIMAVSENHQEGRGGGGTPPYPKLSLADDVAVVQVACGQHHTVLVTRAGGVLVCGSNGQGQLGFSLSDQKQTQVCPLERLAHPSTFFTAAAGAAHTILLDSEGSVWQMGGDDQYQEGPVCVLKHKRIGLIAAGGDHSVALSGIADVNQAQPPALPGGQRITQHQISMLTSPQVLKIDNKGAVTNARNTKNITQDLTHNLEGLLISVGRKSIIQPSDDSNNNRQHATEEFTSRMEELLQNPSVMNSLFFSPAELDRIYSSLISAGNVKVQQAFAASIERGIRKGLASIACENARLIYPEAVRCLLTYILFFDRSSFDDNEIPFDVRGSLLSNLLEVILGLPFEGYQAFLRWAISMYPADLYRKMLVKPLLYQLEKSCRVVVDSNQVMHASMSFGAIPLIVGVLQWLFNASERVGILPAEDFVSTALDKVPVEALYGDLHSLKMDKKRNDKPSCFHLCSSPFLLSPSAKRNLLQMENQIEMYKAATANGITLNLATGSITIDPFFYLEVEREKMLEQALTIIQRTEPSELRKHLRVKFKGEEGVDAGGVTKEFFQLLSEKLFSFSSGKWTDKYGDDITWFNPDCMWDDVGFELTGVLVGLALYNSVLLDVNFPMAVYRKLLGYPLGLEDMVDMELKRGFQQLLDYEGGDEEYVFCLNFEVTWVNDLGEEVRRELKSGGADIPVTNENKEEYVRLYVRWLLVDSIYPQWHSFETGVMRVMDGSSFRLCRPEELELLVVGTPELDFDALEGNTEYEGGYTKDSETVKNFWRYAKSLDLDSQVKFLKFATGACKAPIGGLAALPFKIQRAGPDSPQLPTSHTCFNTLILPDYDSYDKLAERLGRAIVECEGFGLE